MCMALLVIQKYVGTLILSENVSIKMPNVTAKSMTIVWSAKIVLRTLHAPTNVSLSMVRRCAQMEMQHNALLVKLTSQFLIALMTLGDLLASAVGHQ